MLFKAIMSSTWEQIDQLHYTKLAQCIDPIDSTITFYAEVLASGMLKSFNKKGVEVTDNDKLIKLLQNPNENQNFQQFIKEWLYYHFSHGWNYIVPRSTSVGFEKNLDRSAKTMIYNLDGDLVEFNSQVTFASYFGLNSNKEITFDYKPYSLKKIAYSEVIPFFDVRQNSLKPHIGVSRLLALKPQIENYDLAQQGKKALIKSTGSRLVSLNPSTKEDVGMDSVVGTGRNDEDGNPITTTHKELLETQMADSGLAGDGKKLIFSSLPLIVQNLSTGLENISFDNFSVQDARVILNKFNLPKEFQNLTTESAKFANREMAMIEVVQNTIQPLADSFCEKMKTFFNWENDICISYDHLPIFSVNESTKLATKQSVVNLYKGLLDAEIITVDEYKLILKENGIIS